MSKVDKTDWYNKREFLLKREKLYVERLEPLFKL